ncbi:MAG: hypothetical protein AAFX45_02435 [Pseudomonadota bacterium]
MQSLKTPLLWTGLGLALAATVFFAIVGMRGLVHVRPEMVAEAPIAGWMTPRYVGHSWDVPREVIEAALAIDRTDGRLGPLSKIAGDRGVPLADLVAALEAAIADHRAGEE